VGEEKDKGEEVEILIGIEELRRKGRGEVGGMGRRGGKKGLGVGRGMRKEGGEGGGRGE